MQRLVLVVPTSTYRARAFVEAARRLDVHVTLASEHPSSLSPQLPDDLLALDFEDPVRLAEQAAAFGRRCHVDAVVGVDEQAVVPAARFAAVLGVRHNPPESVVATRNKLTMRERLASSGVSVPAFRPFPADGSPLTIARQVDYPCVIKPLMLAASRGVVRADDPEAFARAFEWVARIIRAKDSPSDAGSRSTLLVEAYVPGWEVAVEGMVTDGRLHVLTVFDKPDPLEGPYFPETLYVTPSRLGSQHVERISNVTQEAVRALGLRDGPIHAELRGTDEDLWVIEVAARSIGGYCSKVLRFGDGASLEDVILRHALGTDRSPPRSADAASGVMMLQAPRAGRLIEVRGVDAARAVAGINEIIVSARIGDVLEPLPEGFLYTAFLFARGETPERVEKALRSAERRITFVVDPP